MGLRNLFKWLGKKQQEAEGIQETSSLATLGYQYDYDEQGNEDALWGKKDKEEPTFKFKAVLSNKTLTVFLDSGDILTNTGADREMFLKVRDAQSEEEIRRIMIPPEVLKVKVSQERIPEELQEYDADVKEAIPEIVATGEFTKKGDKLYLNGIDSPLPRLLAKEFLKSGSHETQDYYDSLKKFWCWCVLNPDPVAKEDLFGFLERGDFKITKNGFFLGYRMVVSVKGNKDSNKALIEFVTAKYLNIKTKQKKSPKNYFIYSDPDGGYVVIKDGGEYPEGITQDDVVGNLAELYNQLADMEDNLYTDAHTHTMKIKLGSPVSMPREECDNDPFADCSNGLHIGNKSFGYAGVGDTSVVVLVNPMNVVAVPNRNANKMRVCEYLPLGIVDNTKNWLEDADALQIEEGYADSQLSDLVALASNTTKQQVELKKALGGQSIVDQVVAKLEGYKGVINQRVVKA